MSIEIQQQIKKAGLKVTQARVAVLSLIAQQQESMTVKQLYQHLYQSDKKLSLATVYRVIADLEFAGLIHQNQLGRGEAKYTLPHTTDLKLLQIKCADLSCLDHDLLVESLQNIFQKFNVDLLEIEFKKLPKTTLCNREIS
ncbi:Fur family transcriptional regulator [Acinetobacter stercoris]|uniref:Ferric uptake regulation protein n=1 Tax=Acinetobacter stercoris TaxID=2126983 RepID=A0A2U3MVK1_9GAMM|nr:MULTISPECIES: transcriptional repressor [Acinetobacter]SPL69446.1 Ferric uptake regulation protein [Acinetobacter stercoris]